MSLITLSLAALVIAIEKPPKPSVCSEKQMIRNACLASGIDPSRVKQVNDTPLGETVYAFFDDDADDHFETIEREARACGAKVLRLDA